MSEVRLKRGMKQKNNVVLARHFFMVVEGADLCWLSCQAPFGRPRGCEKLLQAIFANRKKF